MKQGILMRTNVLICIVVIGGFAITSLLSYQANYGASLQSIEQVSWLASDSIYYRLSSEFAKPVSVSLTMSNDSLLENLLAQEADRRDDPRYVETIRDYLASYREQYGYDSVFLVSAETGRYYNFEGVDRVLERGDPENDWYFALLEGDAEHAMNVDNDEAAHDEITVFVNCKILMDGRVLGVVGVGMRVEHLQALFKSYRDEFSVEAFLVDDGGTVEVSADHNGHEGIDYFSLHDFSSAQRDGVLGRGSDEGADGFWADGRDPSDEATSYVVTRFVEDLGWHLVVERDTSALIVELHDQLVRTVLVIVAIVAVILVIITSVIRSFNRQIVRLTQSVERERRTAFEKATGQMFDGIYELDVTRDRPANREAEEYFESLGAPRGLPFSSSLRIVAEKQIKEEFRQGYLDMFSPESVLSAFQQGHDVLSYECQIRVGEGDYYWMRITARIVQNDADGSVRMLVYRQNIDAEKRQESRMHLLAMTDETTGLFTKSATKRLIEQRLAEDPERLSAFFIFDIDVFKQANDRFGHAFGDTVIESFTGTIRASFRKDDIIGRVGGDEFVAFVAAPSATWAKRKAQALSHALDRDHEEGGATWHMSASIGIALAPRDGGDFETLYRRADEALYRTKERGRNGFTLFGDE